MSDNPFSGPSATAAVKTHRHLFVELTCDHAAWYLGRMADLVDNPQRVVSTVADWAAEHIEIFR